MIVDPWFHDLARPFLAKSHSPEFTNDKTFALQNIARIPNDLKMLYKTVWEIKQKTVLKMAADRAPFIDQSQSLNIHLAHPTYAQLCSMHFYGWKAVSIRLCS